MSLSIETKAFGWALLAALASLAGALVTSAAIALSRTSSADLPAKPPALAQGRQFFMLSCSECHGDDARGGEGPDLHHLAISNARIASTIKNGIKGEMPGFTKKYNDTQVAALVSYLRSLK